MERLRPGATGSLCVGPKRRWAGLGSDTVDTQADLSEYYNDDGVMDMYTMEWGR